MVQFNQIRRGEHLPDLIVLEILAQISDGALKPGDALPTETALAESFGVGRNVVREAIARLRSDGVIHTKQGRGARVLPTSKRATFRINTKQLAQKERRAELFELRGVLETGAARFAAKRRDAADLVSLEDAVQAMTGQAGFDEAGFEADAAFHRALGAATKNEYLASIVDYLSGLLKETTRATVGVFAQNNLLELTVSEHRAILEAVRDRDVSAAGAAMATHIARAAARLDVDLPKASAE